MLRRAVFAAFLCSLAGGAFAAGASEGEGYLCFGGTYSHASEISGSGSATATASMEAVGAVYDTYAFFGKEARSGMFVRDDFLFPQSGQVSIGGVSAAANYRDYDSIIGIAMAIGPAWRFPLAQDVALLLGIGPTAMDMLGHYGAYSPWLGEIRAVVSGQIIGAGLDANVLFRLSEQAGLIVGLLATYNFASYSDLTINGESAEGWADGYSGFSVRPHAGFAVHLVSKPRT